MKRRAFLLGVVSILVAGQASAEAMVTWTRISLQFTNLGRVEASDTAYGVSTLNTSGAGMHLNTIAYDGASTADPHGDGLVLNTILPVTDPIVTNGGIVEVRLTSVGARADGKAGPQGAPGVLNPISGAIQSVVNPGALGLGTVPTSGMVRICLGVPDGCTGFTLDLEVGETVAGVAVGGGVGGLLTIGGTGPVRISILGAPYTVKTIAAFNRTVNGGMQTFYEKGFAHGPLSVTSSTGQTSGVLQVVTTNHTNTVGVPGNNDISGQFSRILVHFVPEPGLLLLLGSGAAGMALLGRKRIRK